MMLIKQQNKTRSTCNKYNYDACFFQKEKTNDENL